LSLGYEIVVSRLIYLISTSHYYSAGTHKKGAIGKEQVDSQVHHRETKQFELYPGSAHQRLSRIIWWGTDGSDFVIWANDVEIAIIKDFLKHVIDSLFGCPWSVGFVFTA
jgi:hypothetical protein